MTLLTARPSPADEAPCQPVLCGEAEATVLDASEEIRRRWEALTAELSGCLPAFSVLRAQLVDAIKVSERPVLQACESFQGIANRARETVALAAQSLGETDSDGGARRADMQTLFGLARKTFEELLERIDRASRCSLETARQMKEIAGRVEGIYKLLTKVDSIASGAKILALNAKIEATRAGAHGKAFNIVATEISRLASEAADTSGVIRGIVQEVNGVVQSAAGTLADRATNDTREAQASRGEVGEVLEALAATHTTMRELVEAGARNSNDLARDIAQAVIALQFQDAMSQQINHVIEALREMETGLEAHLPDPGGAMWSGTVQTPVDWQERLTQRYTMASERRVQADSLGQQGTADIGDNIELC